MLILSRLRDERIIIDHDIAIVVVDVRYNKVRLGIEAPRSVEVHREEIYREIQAERKPHELEWDAHRAVNKLAEVTDMVESLAARFRLVNEGEAAMWSTAQKRLESALTMLIEELRQETGGGC